MAIKQIVQFVGMNTDDSPQRLPPGDYLDACDIRVIVTDQGNDGFIETPKGNSSKFSELGFSLPSGTNITRGRANDIQNNRLIWLNYNSNGNHGIYCYNLNNNTIQTVMVSSLFNLQPGIVIHSIDILNNILGGTDGFNRPFCVYVNSALEGQYGSTIIQEMITDVKIPPAYPPVCTPVYTTGTNNIQSLYSFQFIFRYVFFGGEKSVFSSVSHQIPTGYVNEGVECITLDITGCELFTKPQLQNTISYVEFAVRNVYTLNFYQFARLTTAQVINGYNVTNPATLALVPGQVNYFDTEAKTAVDNADYLMPYSSVPLLANTMDYQDNIKFYGGCTEGYNAFPLVKGANITAISPFELPAVGGIPDATDCDLHINQKYLKPDSGYGWGLIWVDNYGYKSAVQTVQGLSFTTAPYDGNNAKANGVQFILPLSVTANWPAWATHFILARTPNKSVDNFFQGRVNNVLYCTGYDSSGNPIYILPEPGPGNSNLTDVDTIELHLDTSNWLQYGINIPYQFETGDKVTFITTGGNGSTSSSQSTVPAIIELAAPAALAHLNIISQVGNLLKIDYSTAFSITLNAIANDPSGANNQNESGASHIPVAMIAVGNSGYIAFFGYENDASYPTSGVSPSINISPTTSNLYACAMSGTFDITSGFQWFNNVLIGGDNGEIWMNTVRSTIVNFDLSYPSAPGTPTTWVKLNTGVTTTIRCISFDMDHFATTGLVTFWACGDSGVILKIQSPTPDDYIPANFVITSYTNASFPNLYGIDASESLSNSAIVCGANGFIAYTNTSTPVFTQPAGTSPTCNKLNSISIERLGGGKVAIVGDSGTLLVNSVDITTYSDYAVVASETASNLYCIVQQRQFDTKLGGYTGNLDFFSIVGESNTFLQLDLAAAPAISDLSSNIPITERGDSKGCVYQYAQYITGGSGPFVVHNDTFVCGTKDTLYGILETPDITSIAFIDLTTPAVGKILGVLSLKNILNWGAKVEIYTPLGEDTGDIYYEYGDVFPVGQDYTFYKGKEDDGDVFVIKKNFEGIAPLSGSTTATIPWAVKGDVIFSMQPNANNTTGQGIATPGTNSVTGDAISTPIPWDLDYGRPNVVLLYPELQQFRNILRFSDPYVQNSFINGLSSFQQLNYSVIPAGWGDIRKITQDRYIMLINCERETGTAYINRTLFQQTSSSPGVTALSDQVINNITILQGGYGCTNPGSVAEYKNTIYFYSRIKGQDCIYNNNGIYPISENKLRTFFYNNNNENLDYCSLLGGIDPKFRQRLLTYNYEFAFTQETAVDIEVGLAPSGTLFAPNNNYLFSINNGDASITPINTATNIAGAAIPIGGALSGGIFSPSDNCLYLPNTAGYVVVVDTVAMAVVTSIIGLGSSPNGAIYYNNKVYITNVGSGTVSTIDVNPSSGTYRQVIHTSAFMGDFIISPELNADNGEIYYSATTFAELSVLSASTNDLLTSITLPSGSNPHGPIYAPNVKRVYVCLTGATGTNQVAIIDTNPANITYLTVLGYLTLPADGALGGIFLNNFIWISGGVGNFLYGIDTTMGLGKLVVIQPTGNHPQGLVADTNNNNIFITTAGDTVVTVYDTINQVVLNNINVGFHSESVTFVPSNGKIYAAVTGSDLIVSLGGMIPSKTISYTEGDTEDKKRWGNRHSFVPEMYGWIENDMFTFLNGELWVHNNNETYANYYNVQYKPTITIVCNQEPNKVKILQHIQVASSGEGVSPNYNLWNATITTPEGQESQLIGLRNPQTGYAPPQDWSLLEGMYCASVLRDINTPNIPSGQVAILSGDLMRSEVFKVTLECESANMVVLKYVNFYYIYSRATNK